MNNGRSLSLLAISRKAASRRYRVMYGSIDLESPFFKSVPSYRMPRRFFERRVSRNGVEFWCQSLPMNFDDDLSGFYIPGHEKTGKRQKTRS